MTKAAPRGGFFVHGGAAELSWMTQSTEHSGNRRPLRRIATRAGLLAHDVLHFVAPQHGWPEWRVVPCPHGSPTDSVVGRGERITQTFLELPEALFRPVASIPIAGNDSGRHLCELNAFIIRRWQRIDLPFCRHHEGDNLIIVRNELLYGRRH